MIDSTHTISNKDYKNIFIDIAEKLFTRKLIDDNEKVKLINIINKDENLLEKVS